MVIEISNKTKSKINLRLIKKTAEDFLLYYKDFRNLLLLSVSETLKPRRSGKNNYEVSIVFVGDRLIRRLNKIYRGTDKTTDVLSFEGEENFLGEIIICYPQIKRQAKKYKHSARQELVFVLVHGLLHLLGYDDKIEKGRREMMALGEEFMKCKMIWKKHKFKNPKPKQNTNSKAQTVCVFGFCALFGLCNLCFVFLRFGVQKICSPR